MDAHDNNHHNHGQVSVISPEVARSLVVKVLEAAPLELSVETAVREQLLPLSVKILTAAAENFGDIDEVELSLMMLSLGYAIGFQAGHFDGHFCAEGFVPDSPNQIDFGDD
jgi:hypothetical protein